ncbi:MAG: MFS transporter [Anaerolineales bacterium]|uniref:MFS transporter n=1 Tax=Promineifilum sp. TaxID=2664178 RepID=UPI001DFE0D8D|nr:MFS transporter [Anaerolineales bacterium]MCO5179472.1 MFS transporter [Promineifilum sp.]
MRSMRPFLTLWTGQVFSLIGSQLVQFALIWWLTQETGSATVLAFASIVGLVPQVILGPFVGPLIDRWNRKRTMIVADAVVALSTTVLVYLFATDTIAVWHVFVALFVRALGGAFHWPAMTASTSLMVPPQYLTRVQGLNQILNGGLGIASAPLGALLLSLFPMQNILMIDIVTAALAIVIITFVAVPQPESPAGQAEAMRSAYFADLRAGLRYLLNWRGLLVLAGMGMLVNMVLSPTNSFMPLLVTDHFAGTAWHLGLLEAGFGIGVVGGGILLGVWGGFQRRVVTSLLGLSGIGLGIIIVGLAPASLFPLAVAGMIFGGVMSSLCNGPIMAVFQSKVSPAMQGRVFTLVGSATAAMMPLGLIVAGPLADIIGVRAWFLGGGLITFLVGVAGFFVPALMNIESERESGPQVLEDGAPLLGPLMEPAEGL